MVRPRHFRFPLAAAALLALAGCPPQDRPLTGSGMDMFAPVKMRIHPLTRAVASPAQIEARIEFTDQMGDVTKGVGTLQLGRDHADLFMPADAGRSGFCAAGAEVFADGDDDVSQQHAPG